MAAAAANRIPVTILTGFLGSGKTTLLERLLKNPANKKRLAVIENEYAAPIGIDNEMKLDVRSAESVVYVAHIKETTSGCVCCAGRGDFMDLLVRLIKNRTEFDYLLIETDGMSDPAFAKVFFESEHVRSHLYVDGIVTVVDAFNIMPHLALERDSDKLNEAYEQIAVADRVILNKIDLVDSKALQEVERKILAVNPAVTLLKTTFSNVDADSLLGIKAFELSRVLRHDPHFMELRPQRHHDASVGAVVLQPAGPLDLGKLKRWLEHVHATHPLLRSKGLVHAAGSSARHTFQGVMRSFQLSEHKPWDLPEAERFSRLVFIGRNLKSADFVSSFEQTLGVKVADENASQQPGIPSFAPLILSLMALYLLIAPDDARALLLKLPLSQYTTLLVDYRMYLSTLGTIVWGLSNLLLARRARRPA
jgi:G3E family GTPase